MPPSYSILLRFLIILLVMHLYMYTHACELVSIDRHSILLLHAALYLDGTCVLRYLYIFYFLMRWPDRMSVRLPMLEKVHTWNAGSYSSPFFPDTFIHDWTWLDLITVWSMVCMCVVFDMYRVKCMLTHNEDQFQPVIPNTSFMICLSSILLSFKLRYVRVLLVWRLLSK